MKIITKNATLIEKYIIRKWTKKWAKELNNLKLYDIETTIFDKTDDKWTGDLYFDGRKNFITLERPITEKVFHHELFHVHLNSIFRPIGANRIQPFFNFDACEINRRTKYIIMHLHSLIEEWFVELNTFQHLYAYKGTGSYSEKYLGHTIEEYLNDLNFNFIGVDHAWFNNLNTVLTNTLTDNTSTYVNLFKHAILWDAGKLPPEFNRCKSNGVAKQIAKTLQDYRDLDKLDTNYSIHLFADLLNIIGSQHPKITEPIVKLIDHEPTKRYDQLIFTSQFKIVVKKFDDGMAAIDRQADWIISQIKFHISNGTTDLDDIGKLVYHEFCKIEGKKALPQFESIFYSLYSEITG